MRTWTVHLHARHAPVLVPEAASLSAALLGPLWLLAHRAWAWSAVWVLGFALLATLIPTGLAWAAIALTWALFGNDAWRSALAGRGFVLAYVVAARDEDAAFARFIHARPDLADRAAALA